MLTKNINFKNFDIKKNTSKIKKDLNSILNNKNEILKSLGPNYKNSYSKKLIKEYKKKLDLRIIGMGGSILGAESIFNFLKHKIKKKITFINNLKSNLNFGKSKKKILNLIVSKSGNTLETIVNFHTLVKKKDSNIFITENKNSYLLSMAEKLKAEVVNHNNFIGGRYSFLSEVGMLPAELMGLKINEFKQINNLVKNKRFINELIKNVACKLFFFKKKRFNSIILNYDEESDCFFKWYQQLISESLGKKGSGFLPTISTMPKDNHSLMQLYLDGPRNNFFTFFFINDKNSTKIKNDQILSSHKYLKNKTINKIIYSQKIATQNTFLKKNIPFRSFEVTKRNEKTLGELFSFFILETILLGRALKVNPYDQPSVELIKKETKKILI